VNNSLKKPTWRAVWPQVYSDI